MPRALILCGGWDGHEPFAFTGRYLDMLEPAGYDVVVAESLDVLDDPPFVQAFDLVIPVWTMGVLTEHQEATLVGAVGSGVGLAGQHGGMSDAFRTSTEYQWVVGGQFVWHPPGRELVHVTMEEASHPLLDGIDDFAVETERYYLHMDPSVEVLATTIFDDTPATRGEVTMPVVWTRAFGRGRVFYCSLGHAVAELDIPELTEVMKRGFTWATRGER